MDTKLVSVISHKKVVGFLVSSVRGWKAYDAEGLPIGMWASESDAARAVYAQKEAAPS